MAAPLRALCLCGLVAAASAARLVKSAQAEEPAPGNESLLELARGGTSEAAELSCTDTPPDNRYTCQQQQGWGQCGQAWMRGFCCRTCFNCVNCGGGGGGGGGGTMADFLRLNGLNRHHCGIQNEGGHAGTRRQEMKRAFADACRQHACTVEEHSVIVAVAMQESNTMDYTDTSKGTNRPESNFSPLNMNVDQLGRLGCNLQCAQSMGQFHGRYNIPLAVQFFLRGLRRHQAIGGTCDHMNFHRFGYTGWRQCFGQVCTCDCPGGGCLQYKNAISDMVRMMLRDRSFLTDGRRICFNVPWV